jgi:hypothetical protein
MILQYKYIYEYIKIFLLLVNVFRKNLSPLGIYIYFLIYFIMTIFFVFTQRGITLQENLTNSPVLRLHTPENNP